MFANKKEAKLLRWHEEGRNKDGMICHPANCAQWRHFDNTYGWFGNDPRNIRFALSTDGTNPYGNMSTSHSTWPVLLSIMNLPHGFAINTSISYYQHWSQDRNNPLIELMCSSSPSSKIFSSFGKVWRLGMLSSISTSLCMLC